MGQVENQIDKGREALKYFHNEASKYSAYNYRFDEMLNIVSRNKPSIFLEGMGFAIEQIGPDLLSTGDLKSSMENLARQGEGKIPSQSSFFSALSGKASGFSWSMVGNAASETVSTVAEGLSEGGQTIVTTLKSLNFVLPLLIVGGVIYVFIKKARAV